MGTNDKQRKNGQQYQAGDNYGKLTLTGKSYIGLKSRRYVEVICQCGEVKFMKLGDIMSGHTSSCGCGRKPHGMSPTRKKAGHPLYVTWANIKNRCYQKSHKSYLDYGGKGIRVCEEWLEGFKPFFDWATSNGWEEGLTLDRIKNEFGYSPENCRWITNAQQQRNKRGNVNITAWGETKCLMDWINDERSVVGFNTVRSRMVKLKWAAEKAISEPSMNNNRESGNRANSIKIEYKGETKCLKMWCKILELSYSTIRNRLYKGWMVNDAFETPKYLNKITNVKT